MLIKNKIMKKITNKCKKISTWIFRDSLELGKHWWHRLIKVIFLSLFILVTIGSYIALIANPSAGLLSKHNILVKNTLYQFTENYKGEDYDNTIPKFFEQKGNFGLLVDNKIKYISEYSLGESFCLKTPEKYLDGISKLMYTNLSLEAGKSFPKEETQEWFSEEVIKNFYEDTTRKCYFFDVDEYSDIKEVEHLSEKIINYRPNALFYLEAIVGVSLIALVSFILFALIYYRLILYIVYGNKK